ncbi:MAG: hypothetical protein IKE66_11630 [Hyphomicrobium sp.]|nr:hypothetical protein [Hyphomicrobium sp.]
MKTTRAARAARFILVISALLLPTLSLVPLGGLYLWEKGWLLWWAIAATSVITAVYLLQKYLLASPEVATADADAVAEAAAIAPGSAANPTWTNAEQRAWADVLAIAAKVNPDKLTTSKALFDLGHHTVNAVAKRMHPTKTDALWQFTMPEALAITERVSQRLGRFVEDTIPFGDRLTVSQVLTVYSWRSVADVAEKAYDIWRILRFANPVTAVTHEARERLSRAMLAWGKDHVSRRLAETFVLEVGRAAIDLYGGRLRISRDDILENRIDASSVLPNGSGSSAPFKLLVTGPARGRIPKIVATLESMRQERADSITAFVRGEAADAGLKALTAIDVIDSGVQSGAVTQSSRDAQNAARLAREADIIVWAYNGVAAPDEHDLQLLRMLSSPDAPVPPVLVPLVFRTEGGEGARFGDTMALQTALASAHPGYVATAIVLDDAAAIANPAPVLWATLSAIAAEARRVQFARALEAARNRRDWTGAAKQAATAAGALAKSMLPGRGPRG